MTTPSTSNPPTTTRDITMANVSFPSIERLPILSASENNWVEWKIKLDDVLVINGLWGYTNNTIECPDHATDHKNAANWEHNDRIVCAILSNCTKEEDQRDVKTCKSATEAWELLVGRYEKQGPMKQIMLIQELFNIQYSDDELFSTTTAKIRQLASEVFTIGVPNEEVFVSIIMLNAMKTRLPHIRDSTASSLTNATLSNPYTSYDISKRLNTEQQLIRSENAIGVTMTQALAANSGRGGKKSGSAGTTAQTSQTTNGKFPPCLNCTNTNHPLARCFAKGGPMEGKRDEVLAMVRAERAVEKQKKPGGAMKSGGTVSLQVVRGTDSAGRAFCIDTTSGDMFYISNPTSMPKTSPAKEFAGLASEHIPTSYLESVSSGDDYEYNAFACIQAIAEEEAIANVDWNKESIPTIDVASIAIERSDNPTRTISASSTPFFMDSGTTAHISHASSDFCRIRPITSKPVKGIGGSTIQAIGVGDIRMRVSESRTIIMRDVLYIPNAAVRLLSVSALCRNSNVTAHFDNKDCWVTNNKDGQEIARGRLESKQSPLYRLLDRQDDSATANNVTKSYIAHGKPTLETWHKRLGHTNYQSIMDMACNDLAEGMPIDLYPDPPKCEHCIIGKQTRCAVPKIREGERATRRLGIVYADLMGPMDVKSACGNLYVLDIIDDFTSYTWAIPIAAKSDALPAYRSWQLAREREDPSDGTVGTLRSDNGELKSRDMTAFLDERGTKHQFTAPYTSAHAGKVERVHRTLMGKARAMRLATDVPTNRWDEFILTTCYLTNRTPSRSLTNKTPFEAWHGRKPDLKHLREIGSRAFVLIQNEHNPKIYSRSVECILIGYSLDSKSYRCYHRATRKVISSFHVKFIESHETSTKTDDQNSQANPSITQRPPFERTQSTAPAADDDEPQPAPITDNDMPKLIPPELNPIDDANPADNESEPLANTEPRRSARISVPSAKAAEASGINKLSAVQRAVMESKESGDRVRAERKERREAKKAQMIEEPEQEEPETPETMELDEADMAMLAEIVALLQDNPIRVEGPDEPANLREVMESQHAKEWQAAYNDEFKSIKDMEVYELIPRSEVPKGRRVMWGRSTFIVKYDEDGNPARFKVRYVCKGYEAVMGKDYDKTTSPTARLESFRAILHIAASMGWEVHQVDVKTAFLNGTLNPDEVCYMEQPDGLREGEGDLVWKLQKALYGMKQAGRVWNRTMNDAMIKWGFTRLLCEYCVYYRKTKTGTIVTAVHVDDFLTAGSNTAETARFKNQMRERFTISDLGIAKFCLGIKISHNPAARTISISQMALIDRIINQFGLIDAYPVSTPLEAGTKLSRDDGPKTEEEAERMKKVPYRSLVGSLMYVAVGTRPDIMFAVQFLCQFLDCYGPGHWEAAKRVVRYLKGTRELELNLGGRYPDRLIGFTDLSYASCVDTRHSVSGYCFTLGSGMISWASRKQKIVATSSCEAEYVAASDAAKELVWLRSLLTAIGFPRPNEPTPLLCDNNGAIVLSGDPSFHNKSKHIDVKYHHIRQLVNNNEIKVSYVNTHDNITDTLNKALEPKQFIRLRGYLGLS